MFILLACTLLLLFLMIYPYAVYPKLLKLLMIFKKHALHSLDIPNINEDALPSIAVLIAAYNESEYIEDAIHTIYAQRYPRCEVHVGSDGSTDDTVKIVERLQQQYPNLHVHRLERRGKNAVNEYLVSHSNSDVIVHLDADVRLQSGALYSMCSRFTDPHIGAVIGTSIDAPKHDSRDNHAAEHSVYRSLEFQTRSMESALSSTVTSLGHFYAVRRIYRRPLSNDKRVLADPHACAYEIRTSPPGMEFKQAKRFAACGMATVGEADALLSPKYGLIALFLWSRKMLRWLMPIFYLLEICTSFLAWHEGSIIGMIIFHCLLGVILLSIPGFLGLRIIIIRQACIFVRLQMSLLGAWIHVLRSNASSTWERA
jgi:glycosyltransferase involved in cell wall biosynthesis